LQKLFNMFWTLGLKITKLVPCRVDASYNGSFLWQNVIFFLGTLSSNVYGDEYAFGYTNWDIDLVQQFDYEHFYLVIFW